MSESPNHHTNTLKKVCHADSEFDSSASYKKGMPKMNKSELLSWANNLRKVCDSDSKPDGSASYKKDIPKIKSEFPLANISNKYVISDSESDSESYKKDMPKIKPDEFSWANNGNVCDSDSDTESDSSASYKKGMRKMNKSELLSWFNDLRKLCDSGSKSNSSASYKKDMHSKIKTAFLWASTLKQVCDSDTESESSDSYNEDMFHDIFETDSSSDEDSDMLNAITTEERAEKRIQPKASSASTSKFSFLASLSSSAPKDKCDMSALIFRDHFQTHKHELVKKLFDLFNEKVFKNSIPKNTPFDWSDRLLTTAGNCRYMKSDNQAANSGLTKRAVKITLATKLIDSADRLRDVLIHELCHAATWIVNNSSENHDFFWQSWAFRAMRVFPELPPIQKFHNYVIGTKYTYKCTDCGSSFGRHRMSLDTTRIRCGLCDGKFQVFMNIPIKKEATKTVATTSKKVNGSPSFGKENFEGLKTPERKLNMKC